MDDDRGPVAKAVDAIMAMAGVQTDGAKVREDAEEMRHSMDPSVQAAVEIADGFHQYPDSDLRRMLPDLGNGPIPRRPELRWDAVAKAARRTVAHHIEHGDDHALGPDVGAAVRIDTVVRALRHSISMHAPTDEPLGNLLDGITERSSRQVRNFLSIGEAVDDATARRASMPRTTHWGGRADVTSHVLPYMDHDPAIERSTRDEMMVERAMGRAGVLDIDDMLIAARELASYGGLDGDHSRDGGYRRPNQANARLPESERRALVAEQMETIRRGTTIHPAQGRPATIQRGTMAAMMARSAGHSL